MTRRTHTQLLLGEIVLFGLAMPDPGELMDPELQHIDKLLDDEALVDAVVERLRQRSKRSRTKGRPSTPAEVVLRMLVLKPLRGWSYDRLQWEVTGNIAYRQFCRIGAEKVPDAKTLVRLGQRLGDSVLQNLCDRLVQLAVERKVTQGRKMRVDTTVVEAPIAYPTDSDLCEDGIRVLQRHLQRLLAAGVQLPFALKDRSRSPCCSIPFPPRGAGGQPSWSARFAPTSGTSALPTQRGLVSCRCPTWPSSTRGPLSPRASGATRAPNRSRTLSTRSCPPVMW